MASFLQAYCALIRLNTVFLLYIIAMMLCCWLQHGKSSVYSVAWNQKDPKHIATCGGDGYW